MTLPLFMVIVLFSLQCSSPIFCSRTQTAEVASLNRESDRDRDADGRADGDDNKKDGNCTKVAASCIETYDDLESYILNGKNEVISQLKDAFFVTGRPPPEFVYLTYSIQVLCNSAVSCTNYTSRYIWSDQFHYLLGPQPLFWLTLFAVMVPEHNATIDLTKLCLCSDAYDSLLSQLTNMVCTYFFNIVSVNNI